MGIPGLLNEEYCKCTTFGDKIQIDDLMERKLTRIGIDMYVLLHKFCTDNETATLLVNYPDAYIKSLYEKIESWLKDFMNLGFDLYLVYDGTLMKYKITEKERAMRRAVALAKGDMVGAVEITPQQMFNLQSHLEPLHLPYIVAPFEADAQLAWLYKHDYIDIVLTCDSDLIVYGIPRIIFIKPFSTTLKWYEHEKIDEKQKPLWVNEIQMEKLWLFGFLIGCDYFKGVSGTGIKKALDIVATIKYTMDGANIDWDTTFDDVYTAIEQMVSRKVREKLDAEALKTAYTTVRHVFMHQPIFTTDTYELRWLNDDAIPEERKDEFGVVFNAKEHATGKINPIENKPFELIESQCC